MVQSRGEGAHGRSHRPRRCTGLLCGGTGAAGCGAVPQERGGRSMCRLQRGVVASAFALVCHVTGWGCSGKEPWRGRPRPVSPAKTLHGTSVWWHGGGGLRGSASRARWSIGVPPPAWGRGFGLCARVPCDGLGLQWYKAVARAPTAGLTGQGTARHLCVVARGRRAVWQCLKGAVVDQCAASSMGSWLRPLRSCAM